MISGYVRSKAYSISDMEEREVGIRTAAEKVVNETLPIHQRLIFNWVLFHARRGRQLCSCIEQGCRHFCTARFILYLPDPPPCPHPPRGATQRKHEICSHKTLWCVPLTLQRNWPQPCQARTAGALPGELRKGWGQGEGLGVTAHFLLAVYLHLL